MSGKRNSKIPQTGPFCKGLLQKPGSKKRLIWPFEGPDFSAKFPAKNVPPKPFPARNLAKSVRLAGKETD
jgi:hypothetical protein